MSCSVPSFHTNSIIPEPNEIDQIYQVLKQAGAISTHKLGNDKPINSLSMNLKAAAAAAMAAQQQQQQKQTAQSNGSVAAANVSISSQQQSQQPQSATTATEIPRLNVPECPERTIRRGLQPQKPFSGVGQQSKQSLLTAPTTNVTDMSSSGLVTESSISIYLYLNVCARFGLASTMFVLLSTHNTTVMSLFDWLAHRIHTAASLHIHF